MNERILNLMPSKDRFLEVYKKLIPGTVFFRKGKKYTFREYSKCTSPSLRDYCRWVCPGKLMVDEIRNPVCFYNGPEGSEFYELEIIYAPALLEDELFIMD